MSCQNNDIYIISDNKNIIYEDLYIFEKKEEFF